MTGPCLCGDPYCPACGDQRAAFLADLEAEAELPAGTLDNVLRALTGDIDRQLVERFMRMLEAEVTEAWCDFELGAYEVRKEREGEV